MLTPHRSLNRDGFLIVMAFAGVSFVGGLAFLIIGAWPVIGFFGLDVLADLLGVPHQFLRAPAPREILVTPTELSVRRISPAARCRNGASIRFGSRSTGEVHDEYGVERLALVSRGAAPDDRELPLARRKSELRQRSNRRAGGRQARHRSSTSRHELVWERPHPKSGRCNEGFGHAYEIGEHDEPRNHRAQRPVKLGSARCGVLRTITTWCGELSLSSRSTGARSRKSRPWRMPPG